MTTDDELWAEVAALIDSAKSAVHFSNQLFSPPDGLFCRLGRTEADRRAIIESDLFKRARTKIRELESRESDLLREINEQFGDRLPPDTYLRLEPVRQFTTAL